MRLAWILDRPEWRRLAEATVGSVSGVLQTSPISMPQMLVTVAMALDPPRQIVIAGDPRAEDTRAMLEVVAKRFLPGKVVILNEGRDGNLPGKAAEFYSSLDRQKGKATAYVCENYTCHLPTNEPATLASILDDDSD